MWFLSRTESTQLPLINSLPYRILRHLASIYGDIRFISPKIQSLTSQAYQVELQKLLCATNPGELFRISFTHCDLRSTDISPGNPSNIRPVAGIRPKQIIRHIYGTYISGGRYENKKIPTDFKYGLYEVDEGTLYEKGISLYDHGMIVIGDEKKLIPDVRLVPGKHCLFAM